jgi:CheY-like chemotaxis protein
MESKARILIATDNATDGNLVRRLLSDEFENVTVSAFPDRHVADFERCKPAILLLAFNSLEMAERYYLGLYRLSSVVHALPHRTLILCNQDDLRHVYDLCKKEHFDDYILFWPLIHDTPRLPMAVIQALRQMSDGAAGVPTAREFAAQARRIAELELMLSDYATRGEQHIKVASDTLRQAKDDMDAAVLGLPQRMAENGMIEIRNAKGLGREIDRFRAKEIGNRFESLTNAVEPLHFWIDSIDETFAPQMEAVRDLRAMAEKVKPLVLIVEDDELQREILGHLLAEIKADLVFSASGAEALRVTQRRDPDLVLMDVNLPDMNGIDTTQLLRAVKRGKEIPVIMMSGHSHKDIVVESLKVGAVGFVVKPFEKNVLLGKINEFLRR